MATSARVVVEAVDAHQAEEQDEREKETIRNLQDLYPEPDQREIQDEEHGISDVHAGDRAPEKVGVLP